MKLKFIPTFFIPLLLAFDLASCSHDKPVADKNRKAGADTVKHPVKNYISDCKTFYALARRSDSILLGQTELEVKSAHQAIRDFTNFAYYCQGDSLSPVFLIKTAQVARAINDVQEAKLVLDKCIADYPTFRNRAAALFLLAQIYDEPGYLNNEHEAKRLYQKIIDEHPGSDWASSAKGAIMLVGKTDEQIIEEFKKKNKQ